MNPFAKQNVLEALDGAIDEAKIAHQQLIDDISSGKLIKCPAWHLHSMLDQISDISCKLNKLEDLRNYVINIQQTNPLNYSVNLTQDQFKLIQDYYQ